MSDGITTSSERKQAQRARHRNESRGKHSSSTSGKSKGIVASPMQRSMCARNRSYKHPAYAVVMKTVGRKVGQK